MSIRNPWCRPSRLPDRPVSQATHGAHLTSAAHETTRCGPARRAPSDMTVRHPGGGTSKTPQNRNSTRVVRLPFFHVGFPNYSLSKTSLPIVVSVLDKRWVGVGHSVLPSI